MSVRPRAVWFHRDYRGLTGGQVKHAHYVDHVRRAAGFMPRIVFTGPEQGESRLAERRKLWGLCLGETAADWTAQAKDVLFLAGTDWRYLARRGLGAAANPRLNLIQSVRHARAGSELHRYLRERAVRLCVSQEAADAVSASGVANGEVLVIPNGVDLAPASAAERAAPRREQVAVMGHKRPALAAALSQRLHEAGVRHLLLNGFLPRQAFLDVLAQAEVAVCLPEAEEGFYLPALEAMASGCVTVTLDGVGNRSFCRHGQNCLVAAAQAHTLEARVREALGLGAERRAVLQGKAAATVRAHGLDRERERFLDVLRDIDRLWAECASRPAVPAAPMPPLVDFMIVGAQKAGTTALARFLGKHPELGMSASKEVHLFDAPEYSTAWTRAEIDSRYGPQFEHCPAARRRGEATPVYLFMPEVAAQLARYNPDLRLIVLLRDPVERAISSHAMQRRRGFERWPLWLALLAEPFRLRGCRDGRAEHSALRDHAYRARGLYSRQLRNLLRHFPAEQVLVLQSGDLRDRHEWTLGRVFAFLNVDAPVAVPPETVFAGGRRRRHRVVGALLRLSYATESIRLRRLLAKTAFGG
jgi:hypothetical protein